MPFPDVRILDDEPEMIQNPFSGASIELDPQEIAIYDVIMGANMTKNYDLVEKDGQTGLENTIQKHTWYC